MKRRKMMAARMLSVLLAAVLLLVMLPEFQLPVAHANEEPEPVGTAGSAVPSINIHVGPGLDQPIIGNGPVGIRFTYYGITDNNWLLIRYGDSWAYVDSADCGLTPGDTSMIYPMVGFEAEFRPSNSVNVYEDDTYTTIREVIDETMVIRVCYIEDNGDLIVYVQDGYGRVKREDYLVPELHFDGDMFGPESLNYQFYDLPFEKVSGEATIKKGMKCVYAYAWASAQAPIVAELYPDETLLYNMKTSNGFLGTYYNGTQCFVHYVFTDITDANYKDHLIKIGTQPSDAKIDKSHPTAKFSVSATVPKGGDIKYRWHCSIPKEVIESKKLATVTGWNSAELSVSNASDTMSGATFYCEIFGENDYQVSKTVALAVETVASAITPPVLPPAKSDAELQSGTKPQDADNKGNSDAELYNKYRPEEPKAPDNVPTIRLNKTYVKDGKKVQLIIVGTNGRDGTLDSDEYAFEVAKKAAGSGMEQCWSSVALEDGSYLFLFTNLEGNPEQQYWGVWFEGELEEFNGPGTCKNPRKAVLPVQIGVSWPGTQTEEIIEETLSYTVDVAHRWGKWTNKSVSCTGVSYEHKCEVCGKTETKEVKFDPAHVWSKWTVKSSNCTSIVYERSCTRCKKVETKEVKLSAPNHKWGEPVATDGCYKVTYVTTCKACGATDTKEVKKDKETHIWGKWLVITPACKDGDGLLRRTCDRCGKVEEMKLPHGPHTNLDTDGFCDSCKKPVIPDIHCEIGEPIWITEEPVTLTTTGAFASKETTGMKTPGLIPMGPVEPIYPGEIVHVKPDPTKGEFTGWTADGIELTEEQKLAEELIFTMPGKDVTITASYTERIPEVTPTVEPTATPTPTVEPTKAPEPTVTATAGDGDTNAKDKDVKVKDRGLGTGLVIFLLLLLILILIIIYLVLRNITRKKKDKGEKEEPSAKEDGTQQ